MMTGKRFPTVFGVWLVMVMASADLPGEMRARFNPLALGATKENPAPEAD
jgi:hypothetical protein